MEIDYNFFLVLSVDSCISAFFNMIFLICAITRFVRNSIGFFNRNKIKWSNPFFIKMISNIFLSINYFAFSILLSDDIVFISWVFFMNGIIWIICIILLYFEYRRRIDQTWFGLRGFWFINGLIYIIKIVCYYLFQAKKVRQIEFVIIIQGLISIILFYYSIFNPRDLDNKQHVNRLNNNLFEDLLVRDAQIDFISLGLHEEYKENTHHFKNNKDKISKSSSFNTRNYFNNYNKSSNSYLKLEEKTNTDNGIIRIEIILLKQRKFSKLGKNLIQNEIEQEKMTNIKLRFIVQIQKCFISLKKSPKKILNISKENKFFNKNTNQNFNNFKISQEPSFFTYRFKKNLKEIILFNNFILEKYQKNIKKKSKLIIELKELNDSIKNSKNSFQESFVQQLNLIYIKMCKIYMFFISEFLKFSNIDENTVENVLSNFDMKNEKKKFTTSYSENVNDNIKEFERITNDFKRDNEGMQNVNKNLRKNNRNFNSETSFFSEIEEKSFINDNTKIINYINNTMMQKEYVNVEIKEIIYSQNKFDSTFDLNLNMEKINFMNWYDNSISSLNSSQINIDKLCLNNKNSSVFVSFSFKTLFSYLKNYSINYSKFGIVKNLLNLLNEINEIIYLNGKQFFERELSNQLNDLLNDMFHIRSEIFYMFNLNKLLGFELNDIDRSIINSIFCMEENYKTLSKKKIKQNLKEESRIVYEYEKSNSDNLNFDYLSNNRLLHKNSKIIGEKDFNDFNQCINIGEFIEQEDKDLNSIISRTNNNNKKRFLSPSLNKKISIRLINDINVETKDKPFDKDNKIKCQKILSTKDEIININNFNCKIKNKNHNESVLLSDLDNQSDIKTKESDIMNKEKAKIHKRSKKIFHIGKTKNTNSDKFKIEFNEKKKQTNKIKLRLDDLKKYSNDTNIYEERSSPIIASKNELYILNFNIVSDLDRLEKIETKSKETYLIIHLIMSCQKKSINLQSSKSEFDSIITESNEINSWNITICLDELKSLFRDLQEITKENFSLLSHHLTNMLIIIDKINKFVKPITPTGSLISKSNKSTIENNYSNLSERISLTNNAINKKNDNILEIMKKDFVSGINKFFENPNLYILFSKKFREIFNIYKIYNLNKEFKNSSNKNDIFNRSEDSNSNKSILENLLN